MVDSYLSPAQAAKVQASFRRLEKTVETTFWDLTWESFIIERPDDEDVYGEDTWWKAGEGKGRLRDTGVIEPSHNEGIFLPNAPFRMQCLAASALTTNHYLVIEGRVFKVESFKPRAGERTHAHAYLREQFFTALPVNGGPVVHGS